MEPVIPMGNQSSSSLCKRKKNESFKDCFKRECDDFCDTWVSTIAFYTHPQIAVLIATLCTCDAS